ncbi:sulfatase-like hydrolase/transferase [Verrucomicrobiaceae bacterium N1E253]|uniref:Sulfatase-like hydrolase/transferase n=1 Tax=Oceaniferula marina TaxID=2748318 RepID=A0A851GB61_9BACT|nr:sulfatase-like hydrolase/transferase [Oceaniferula marina]NWK54192.1 sulfatase-like hydrolase/transferase [Oceaniferula marina]
MNIQSTLGCLMAWLVLVASSMASDKPNIIFILIDDLGKEWLSCYGGEGIKTPAIDELAKEGIRFNNAYSMPQCTPSRACFLTGQYPFRNGWANHWDAPRWGVGYFDWEKNPSIGRTLKSAGYATAAAGKWQLNDFRVHPDAMVKHGFDEYCMWTGAEGSKVPGHTHKSAQRYWDPYIHTKEGSKTYPGKFGPDIYNDFILNFITENKDKPFFIYYPMALTHGPLVHTPLAPDAKSKLEKHVAMVEYTDFLLGKIVKKLDELQIRKNTLVIWTCDNGTSGSISNKRESRLVKGGKAKTTENGVNTPFIVSCPGLVPQGKVSDALVDFTDMHKTFADLAGVKQEPGYAYDGYSMMDVFLGKKENSARPWILGMGCHPAKLTDQGVETTHLFRDRVIREKRFKLFVGPDRKPVKVVDVINDPDEQINLLNNPEYKEVCDRLIAVIPTLPKVDNDPQYRPIPSEDWEAKSKAKSQLHKKGHPDYVSGPKKERNRKKNKANN